MGTFRGTAPEDKCESRNLAPFVSELNRISGYNYRLVSCLDVVDRQRKQPEILVRDSETGIEAVIERKIIVWPASYLAAQKTDERLCSALLNRLTPLFAGVSYRLEIPSSITWQRLYRWDVVLDQLSFEIGCARPQLDCLDWVDGTLPVPWILYRVGAHEKEDEVMPDQGLVVLVNEPGQDQVLSQLPEIGTRLGLLLKTTAAKFEPHKDRDKILVLEPYGSELVDDAVRQMIPTVRVPHMIDQLWLASADWTTWPPGRVYERLR